MILTSSALWRFVALFVGLAGPMVGAEEETEVLRHIALLKRIKPTAEKEALAAMNTRMDSAWKYLLAHRTVSAPVVRRELAKALVDPVSDQFFVLDAAHLALALEGNSVAPLALQALAKVDPTAEVVRQNFQELCELTDALGKHGGPAFPAQVDRIFLPNKTELNFFQTPHLVRLGAVELGAFFYGIAGPDAEQHVRAIAESRPEHRQRALEILGWIGSEESTPAVAKILRSADDYETFARALKFLMTLGGPAGREAVLSASPADMDRKIADYLIQIRPAVEGVTAAVLHDGVKQLDDPKAKVFSDAQLKKELDKMEANDGVDRETNASLLLTTTLPRGEILAQLKRIRSRSFRRLNQHTLEDVEITNRVINALQYSQPK